MAFSLSKTRVENGEEVWISKIIFQEFMLQQQRLWGWISRAIRFLRSRKCDGIMKLVLGNNNDKHHIIDIGFLLIFKILFDKWMCLLIRMKFERFFVIAFLWQIWSGGKRFPLKLETSSRQISFDGGLAFNWKKFELITQEFFWFRSLRSPSK